MKQYINISTLFSCLVYLPLYFYSLLIESPWINIIHYDYIIVAFALEDATKLNTRIIYSLYFDSVLLSISSNFR